MRKQRTEVRHFWKNIADLATATPLKISPVSYRNCALLKRSNWTQKWTQIPTSLRLMIVYMTSKPINTAKSYQATLSARPLATIWAIERATQNNARKSKRLLKASSLTYPCVNTGWNARRCPSSRTDLRCSISWQGQEATAKASWPPTWKQVAVIMSWLPNRPSWRVSQKAVKRLPALRQRTAWELSL